MIKNKRKENTEKKEINIVAHFFLLAYAIKWVSTLIGYDLYFVL